jgi:hypothetical protein
MNPIITEKHTNMDRDDDMYIPKWSHETTDNSKFRNMDTAAVRSKCTPAQAELT